MENNKLQEYWKKNLTYVGSLLFIWFLVSYVAGIFAVNALDNIRIFGFKLGFWFAQQGSIITFVILIFVYAALMRKLDEEYDVHED